MPILSSSSGLHVRQGIHIAPLRLQEVWEFSLERDIDMELAKDYGQRKGRCS